MPKSQLTKIMDNVQKAVPAKDMPKTAPKAKVPRSIPKVAPQAPEKNIYDHIKGM